MSTPPTPSTHPSLSPQVDRRTPTYLTSLCMLSFALMTSLHAQALQSQQPPTPSQQSPSSPPAPAIPMPVSAELRRAIPEIDARLAALSPSDPESYFLLGEEVADIAVEEQERLVARTLYLIALDLDLARPAPRFAGAACLALAETVSSDRDRLWLQAMARTADPRYAAPDWTADQQEQIPRSLAYSTATALGATRSGDGIAARQLLALEPVKRLLTRYDLLLQPAGGITRIERDATLWPCPNCRNRRVDRARTPGPPPVCSTCQGDPGPRMTDAEIVTHLRLETLLLSGNHTSWAAQMTIDDGAPLRDPDPKAVSRILGVDTSRTLFRNGAWVTPPEG